MTGNRKAKKDPDVISFRLLDPDHRAEFLRRAKANGVSPGDLARSYVTGVLEAAEAEADVQDQLEHVFRELQATRKDFALATEAILEFGGKTAKPVAQEWVRKQLNRPVLDSQPP